MFKLVAAIMLLFALAILAVSLLVTNRRQSGYINQLTPQSVNLPAENFAGQSQP